MNRLVEWAGTYTPADMEWKAIQTCYRRLFLAAKRQGLTQDKLAARAGLAQPDVSRLLNMRGADGPHIRTLLKAIDGLGLTPSEFFRQVEGRTVELQSSSLQINKPLAHDAATPSGKGSVDAASEIDQLAERFARSLVQHVERGLEEGDRSATATGRKQPSRGGRVRRRGA